MEILSPAQGRNTASRESTGKPVKTGYTPVYHDTLLEVRNLIAASRYHLPCGGRREHCSWRTLLGLLYSGLLQPVCLALGSKILGIFLDLSTLQELERQFEEYDPFLLMKSLWRERQRVLIPLAGGLVYRTKDHCPDNIVFHGTLPAHRPRG